MLQSPFDGAVLRTWTASLAIAETVMYPLTQSSSARAKKKGPRAHDDFVNINYTT